MQHKIIWHEGMFLQPTHFQQFERYLLDVCIQTERFHTSHCWGVERFTIDKALLETQQFALRDVRARFYDGTLLDAPARDCLPSPVSVPRQNSACIIYLGIPVRHSGHAEISLQDEHAHVRYTSKHIDVCDAIEETPRENTLTVGQLRPQLLRDHEVTDEYSTIAIASVAPIHLDTPAVLDADFIPTCLNTDNIGYFTRTLVQVHAQLTRFIDILCETKSARENRTQHSTLERLLFGKLQHYLTRLKNLQQSSPFHPKKLYDWMCELVTELGCFSSGPLENVCLPTYQHKHLTQTFLPLTDTFNNTLKNCFSKDAIEIPLEAKPYGLYLATLPEAAFLPNTEWIISIESNTPQKAQALIASLKIAPIESLPHLISHALPGLPLRERVVLPRQIPYHEGAHYFSIPNQHALWEKNTSSPTLGIQLCGETLEHVVSFWLLREQHHEK